MKLQGRNLELNLRGEDVKLLQQELKQLEFQAVQPSGFFDSVTFAAVQNFQIQAAIPEILRRLQEQVVRLALRPAEPDRPTLGMLLDIVDVQAEHKQRIVADYLQHAGPIDESWLRLRRDRDIGDKAVDEIQHVLRLATVTLNHEPLLRELMVMRSRGEVGPTLRALARFSRSDWQALLKRQVQGRPIGVPAVLGGDEDERPCEHHNAAARRTADDGHRARLQQDRGSQTHRRRHRLGIHRASHGCPTISPDPCRAVR